jgi:hypothetical protein
MRALTILPPGTATHAEESSQPLPQQQQMEFDVGVLHQHEVCIPAQHHRRPAACLRKHLRCAYMDSQMILYATAEEGAGGRGRVTRVAARVGRLAGTRLHVPSRCDEGRIETRCEAAPVEGAPQ